MFDRVEERLLPTPYASLEEKGVGTLAWRKRRFQAWLRSWFHFPWIGVPFGVVAVIAFMIIFLPIYLSRQKPNNNNNNNGDQNGSIAVTARNLAPPTQQAKVGAVWAQVNNFSNLDDFRIYYYSSGQNNSNVLVNGLPPSAFASTGPNGGSPPLPSTTSTKTTQTSTKKTSTTTSPRSTSTSQQRSSSTRSSSPTSTKSTSGSTTSTSLSTNTNSAVQKRQTSAGSAAVASNTTSSNSNSGSVLQIFYPKGSYTPSAKPVGGTQFYALTPFDLTQATSVTLNYSVFIPAYYDFVSGGKLPGLYGGAEGCGGGNEAANCWSARMAWRTNGLGELYMYLPQDQEDLKSILQIPPYSYVNTDYGISAGRGSFTLPRSKWTQISQTITLNTKSNTNTRDGAFEIKANGNRVIYYNQVYYPAGIKGILFSTFFGGNTPAWASPYDQYTYFKDFSITINAIS